MHKVSLYDCQVSRSSALIKTNSDYIRLSKGSKARIMIN